MMTTLAAEKFTNLPMGPNLRKWLSLPSDYTPENSPDFKSFNAWLLDHIEEAEVESESTLVELLDELVSMDLPEATLKLADYQANIWTRREFRGVQAEGIAAMILGDLGRAELCFKHAHHAAPEEPAPYTNLIQVLYHDDRLEDARKWLTAGLNTNPNYYRLWELAYAIEQKEGSEPDAINRHMYELAREYNSWAGFSLASETDESANSQTKAHHLSAFYKEGERDHEFLIEYTGALGAASDFEAVGPIYWSAKKASGGKELPWRLMIHAAQAYLSMGEHEKFIGIANDILKMEYIPEEVTSYLTELKKEAEKELEDATKKEDNP